MSSTIRLQKPLAGLLTRSIVPTSPTLTAGVSRAIIAQTRRYSSAGDRPATKLSSSKALLGACGTAALAGSGYYVWRRYYNTSNKSQQQSDRNKQDAWPYHLPTAEEIARRLQARERSVDLPFHPLIKRIEQSQLPSNNPCEDYYCQNALTDGSGHLFGVFDGHAGGACSKWISKALPAQVGESLARLPKDADQTAVRKAIEDAFVFIDDQMVQGSVKRLAALGMKRPGEFDDEKELEETATWLERAMNGACALLTYVNTPRREVTVAVTGDSRAIIGRYEQGQWRAEVLSEDQTADNPSERKRIMSEHPGEEDTVLLNKRVLGGLQPLRAFGDARYKWSLEIQKQIFADYFPQIRASSPHFKTPPYVTARPVVTTHKIAPNDRFMVIATDGLYDDLSNEEIVEVVAGYVDEKSRLADKWSYEEKNAATSLVRNAFGGRDSHKTAQLLSIPAPKSRGYRDDITVLVVFFGEEHQGRVWQDTLKETPTKGVSPSA
ncbi:phosphatase 2C-like domain-containing protein [Syncephalis fuscata]|nr:phosphatase 2C-like domain-containing protein [Syncephalis fuscata]